MKTRSKTTQITMLGLMAAVLFLMAYTPLGYLKVGALSITFNMIPVAISALVMGPIGGAIAGGVFGLTSFLQAMGGGTPFGAALFAINPFFSAINCFVPRILDGLLLGFIFQALRKTKAGIAVSSAITGFFSAFLNTVFFMSALVLLYGNTEYLQGFIQGRNILVFVCAFVGVNAVLEMVTATFVTGAIGTALYKAGLIPGKK